MATKNPFKGTVKALLSKTESRIALVIERKDGKYYLTNGTMLLMVDIPTYDSFLRPLSPMFIPLMDGQRASTENTKELPKIDEGDELVFYKTYSGNVKSEHERATATGFYYTVKAGMGELWKCGDELACFNTKCSEPFRELLEFYKGSPRSSGSWNSGIHFEDEQERCGMFILPVAYKHELMEQRIKELSELEITGRK